MRAFQILEHFLAALGQAEFGVESGRMTVAVAPVLVVVPVVVVFVCHKALELPAVETAPE